MTPPVWLIGPAETRVALPGAVRLPARVRPPAVVVSARLPAEATGPVTLSACASVRLRSPLPVLPNDPRVATWLAPVRLAPPTADPVRVAAVTRPPVCDSAPAETNVALPP